MMKKTTKTEKDESEQDSERINKALEFCKLDENSQNFENSLNYTEKEIKKFLLEIQCCYYLVPFNRKFMPISMEDWANRLGFTKYETDGCFYPASKEEAFDEAARLYFFLTQHLTDMVDEIRTKIDGASHQLYLEKDRSVIILHSKYPKELEPYHLKLQRHPDDDGWFIRDKYCPYCFSNKSLYIGDVNLKNKPYSILCGTCWAGFHLEDIVSVLPPDWKERQKKTLKDKLDEEKEGLEDEIESLESEKETIDNGGESK